MKGSIHSDQTCPVCGSRFKSQEPHGLFCPNHPALSPQRFVVRFGSITKRFGGYKAAYLFLAKLRSEDGAGEFDARDYQIKGKPLSFHRLSDEWLNLKAKQVRPGSLRPLRNAMSRADKVWGEANIKKIKYADVEDLITALPLAPKTKKNTLDALKQFWTWAVDRYEIEPMKKWPHLGTPEMGFRKTISISDQEAILAEVYQIAAGTRIRSWLGCKWLCTYISIRPDEMLSLTEGNVDRGRGLLIIPHPKERRPKIVPLLDEDRELLATLPLAFPDMPFFRHEMNAGRNAGKKFGIHRFYADWKEACHRLGFEGVDLYGGTKHSTAMGLRDVATYEEVRKMTGHTTNRAFDRYLRLEGESMKNLYARRKPVADNRLITDLDELSMNKVFDFKAK